MRAPEDNGRAEHFIRFPKENLLWTRTFDTVEQLRQAPIEFRQTCNGTWPIERLLTHDTAQGGHVVDPSRERSQGAQRHTSNDAPDRSDGVYGHRLHDHPGASFGIRPRGIGLPTRGRNIRAGGSYPRGDTEHARLPFAAGRPGDGTDRAGSTAGPSHASSAPAA